jgi:hypothetical protein
LHTAESAAARERDKAGKSKLARIAITAITTSNSIRVKPRDRRVPRSRRIGHPVAPLDFAQNELGVLKWLLGMLLTAGHRRACCSAGMRNRGRIGNGLCMALPSYRIPAGPHSPKNMDME